MGYRLCLGLCVICLSLLIVPHSYAEELITPNDRIKKHLVVRVSATVSSSPIGILAINDSAKLVSKVPYWYEIELNNGKRGFVSKRWAKIVSTDKGAKKLLRLGSWNIKKLGYGSSKDYMKVAQAIEDNFDIIVVVEVMQKQHKHGGYDDLLKELGNGWKGFITNEPRPMNTRKSPEYYAVLYRPSLVRPCEGWDTMIHYVDNDGSDQGLGEDKFSREPAFTCFEAPTNNSTIGFDFILAAYHATFKNKTAIKAEARHLHEVFESMRVIRSGEKDLIIAGDFNLVPNQLAAETGMGVTTIGAGSTINRSGKVTKNLYDHMLIDDVAATKEQKGNAEVLDIMNISSNGIYFYKNISDHLPIISYFDVSGVDDD